MRTQFVPVAMLLVLAVMLTMALLCTPILIICNYEVRACCPAHTHTHTHTHTHNEVRACCPLHTNTHTQADETRTPAFR